MKKMRRFAAIAAAAAMTACMAVPMTNVFAADGDNDIKITGYAPDSAGLEHSSFAAYQIFDGTWNDGEDEKNLTVSGWGDGLNVDGFIEALQADATFVKEGANVFKDVTNDVTGAQAVANVLSGWNSKSTEAEAFAKLAVQNKADASGNYSNGVISGVADGYYVIADTTAATDDDGNSAYSLGMLYVANDTTMEVAPKVAYPSVVKKVQEDDDTTDDGFGEGYNDVADWDVNTDVPFKVIGSLPSNIDKYDHYYVQFVDTLADNFGTPENIAVTVGSTPLTAGTDYTTSFVGNDLTVTILDVKKYNVTKDTEITLTYTAKLNNSGENKAVIGLDGQENEVYMVYSNNPNVTGDGTAAPSDTGETPEDTVIVFTYELDITKIDGASKDVIKGAQFKLKNAGGKFAEVDASGNFVEWNDTGSVLESDENGLFKVIGIDDGEYQLVELDWSDIYNIPTTPFDVEIDATTLFSQTYKENGDTDEAKEMLKALAGTVAGEDAAADVDAGTVAGTIENNQGAQLPSTGGIGTTLFYVVGGTLAAGAGVALIAKKRMKNED